MCGGVGSRFWPFSKENKPKQFLDFSEQGGHCCKVPSTGLKK